VELKGWFDPKQPEGVAKLVRGCLALRNNDGGFLIVGIDDKTLQISTASPDWIVHTDFHPDHVQSLIAKYASRAFEIFVHYVLVGNLTLPVIEVESGARTPVAAKADLPDPKHASRMLIRKDAVYVRTLLSNNRVSTSEATFKDWERVCDLCFNNREADIGAFVRRHVPALESLLGKVTTAVERAESERRDAATLILDTGKRHFEEAVGVRKLQPTLPEHGSWELGICLDPAIADNAPTEHLLELLARSNPRYTGWPCWSVFRNNEPHRPYVLDGAWQALISSDPGILDRALDFWRIEPRGTFYLYRAFEDDFATSRPDVHLAQLDPALRTFRLAEGLAVALAFAQALAGSSERKMLIASRWSRLAGRELTSWASREYRVYPGRRSRQDAITATTVIPTSIAPDGLAEALAQLGGQLLALFDGYQPGHEFYEDVLRRMLTRRS